MSEECKSIKTEEDSKVITEFSAKIAYPSHASDKEFSELASKLSTNLMKYLVERWNGRSDSNPRSGLHKAFTKELEKRKKL